MDAQSDQCLHCLLTESLDATECMNGEQSPGPFFGHAQDDLNLRILHVFKGTFSLDAAHTLSWRNKITGPLGEPLKTFNFVEIL